MAYQAGDIILDDHYNTFATGSISGAATDSVNINNVLGTGFGDRGYGQASTLAAVAVGNTITATQWATMLARITTLANQQNTSIAAISPPTAGNAIAAFTTLSTNIQAIYDNRLNAHAVGIDATTSTNSVGSWVTSTVHTVSVNFGTANAARYFFNAGGTIRIDPALAGGTVDGKYTEWLDLINTLSGVAIFSATGTTKSGGTGIPTVLAGTIGFYDLTTAYQTIYQQFADSSPYTANYYRIRVRATGTGGNGAAGSQVDFEVSYQDAVAQPAYDKQVYTDLVTMDGTITTTCTVRPPSTTYLTNTWGTPVVSYVNSQT